MASLQASCYIQYSSSSSPMQRFPDKKGTITSILDLHRSKPAKIISLHNLQPAELARGFSSLMEKRADKKDVKQGSTSQYPFVMEKLYAILEIVADRVEMHNNIGQQRENWNSLLLTSINAITLAATTMSAIASTVNVDSGSPLGALKWSSSLMFLAATGMLVIVNKLQPSQLAEEQRNAARLFKQLQNQIETILSIGNPSETDVKQAMDKILALDKAYPLALLGVMLEKFPSQIEPAVWWPQQKPLEQTSDAAHDHGDKSTNGWNPKLEREMESVVEVVRRRDKEEYLRLGGKALKLNKMLAMAGPLLTGVAAIGSAFVGCPSQVGSGAAMIGIVCGALASLVNAMEHGGQVGMVFEMYRGNAGFFKQMEESIESELNKEQERRENGELFEMKTALQLGRSLSGLRDLVSSSSSGSSRAEDELVEEFASKLF